MLILFKTCFLVTIDSCVSVWDSNPGSTSHEEVGKTMPAGPTHTYVYLYKMKYVWRFKHTHMYVNFFGGQRRQFWNFLFIQFLLSIQQEVPSEKGCQMVYFQTKNTNLGKFLGACNVRGWYILWPFCLFYVCTFGIMYGRLVYLLVIW
jgi:hypothetical protein